MSAIFTKSRRVCGECGNWAEETVETVSACYCERCGKRIGELARLLKDRRLAKALGDLPPENEGVTND